MELTFLADDVSRNHAAARRDVRQFRERQAREGRAYLAVEEERVEVNQLLRENYRAVFGERRESFARGRHALLHEIIAVGERRAQSLVPSDLVVAPADVDAVAAVVVIRLEHEPMAVGADEFDEVNRLAVLLRLSLAHFARPRDVPANRLVLFRREEVRVPFVGQHGEERLLMNQLRPKTVD